MIRFFRILVKIILIILAVVIIGLLVLSYRPTPEKVTYGMSFSKFRTDELRLPYEETFLAILDDLGVRHFRFSAHWPNTEPQNNQFNFKELDFQLEEAQKRDASVILAVGRRLPRWPECHIPGWAQEMSWDDQKVEILEYIEAVVTRYKDHPSITYWQVENEPFLSLFAYEHCGELDKEFLKEEIALVKSIDPNTPVLVTDSGNLGLWYEPWKLGDAFGTSLYRYFWNPEVGTFKSALPAVFYKAKHNLVRLLVGNQPTMIVELSIEPWLTKPIVETPIETQLERMDTDKMHEVLSFAHKTGFDVQYLWGAEWWYWMKQNGNEAFWEYGKEVFDASSEM